ncbi:MAG: helicase-exonuclease AddAB subunit AddA [Firmicutes bacterium HGW-Firmicutes-1]|jgi:ATP-dependent helicase/nuclease subunit A|nr:MAG: helicase-exonuclease AddAB subunit AddA [Firmicutes bacterium HGW-Firmicutes-1]
MAVSFTDEQQKVINTRNRNLLVSAAAGSGKTAVLVERIIKMVTDIDNPIDIDQLLVVTFTNAAAAEMRERISDAIEKKLEENPSYKRLHKQLALLSNSNIMTIHAFCLKVIKNHFNEIQLDPSFRIGDENELMLLKNDVLKDLIEENYEESTEDFLHFVESFSSSKSDVIIEELILTLHRFSMSNPWPQAWLDYHIENLNIKDEATLVEAGYYKSLIHNTEVSIEEFIQILKEAKNITLQENGPLHYKDTIEAYIEQVIKIQETLNQGYIKIKQGFDSFETLRLSGKKIGFDPVLKDRAKGLIDLAKDKLVELKESNYKHDISDVINDIQGTYKMMKVLVELTKSFSEHYQIAKEEKNVIDFNDIEHYALNILVAYDEENELKPTGVADIYRDLFAEILIDEYQDSNLVQETILTSVSKERIGTPNMFMVGDVKQSIYKFRLAKPELFMDKYATYSQEDSLFQRINLHKNFRSRSQVVDTINFFFKQAMSKDIGDVTYDHEAALHVGASLDELFEEQLATEVIIVHQQDEDLEPEADFTQKQLEAKAIANRIVQLVRGEDKTKILDKQTGEYRNIQYRDIVILLRTTSGWTDIILDALGEKSIPAYTSTTTGYFETLEITTMMNLLKLIDNPRQDIPLVAVLRSPIVGLKGEELVKIRTALDVEMYDAMLWYVEGCIEEDVLGIKLNKFIHKLNYFRKISRYMPMDELINEIFEKTDYHHYTALMTNGVQRKANLDMFVDKAVTYEKSSYRGVFNFIRYVENIHKYDIDTGEATVFSERDNLVKIMSIHKSKGLEFPIVIVAALGKQFNKQDIRQSIVCHQDLGIGADYVNYEDRYKVETLPKNIIKNQMLKELLSEELRILYVALTRAKEKLILVGAVNNLENKGIKWCESLYNKDEVMSNHYMNSCSCYLDWLMGAFIRHPKGKKIRDLIDCELNGPIAFLDDPLLIDFQLVSPSNLLDDTNEDSITKEEELIHKLSQWKEETMNCDDDISKRLDFKYGFDALVFSKVQMSVSDVKKMHETIDYDNFEKPAIVPKFVGEEEGLNAAQKGTAYHKVMCYLDLTLEPNIENIRACLSNLQEKSILTEKEVASIHERSIINFLKSNLCKKMVQAIDTLKRETPFVIGIQASEMYVDLEEETDDIIMVQGVIDAFYEEDGEIVLIDYKTDYIEDGQEQVLIDRYKEQMDYYKRALEQVLDKKVKEVVIYSLNASKEVNVY